MPNVSYDIYIIPYDESTHVMPGDAIPASAKLGWYIQANKNGDVHTQPIWSVKGQPCEWYEIVLGEQGDSGTGAYNLNTDALDGVYTSQMGFHIYPELPTNALLSRALVGVVGHVGLRRRNTKPSAV